MESEKDDVNEGNDESFGDVWLGIGVEVVTGIRGVEYPIENGPARRPLFLHLVERACRCQFFLVHSSPLYTRMT